MNNQQKQLNNIFNNSNDNINKAIKAINEATDAGADVKNILINALDLKQNFCATSLYNLYNFINVNNVKYLRDHNILDALFFAISQKAQNAQPLEATDEQKSAYLLQLQNTFLHSNMRGKMDGVTSISTLKFCNCNCKKYQNIKGSICEHCYVTLYNQTIVNTLKNTLILCFINFSLNDFKTLFICVKNNNNIVRLESLGDLINAQQAKNYILLASSHKNINFALWTKNAHLFKKALADVKSPLNLNLIISYLTIATGADFTPPAKKMELLADEIQDGRINKNNIKCFLVCNNEDTARNILKRNNRACQCFAQNCATCCNCYKKNNNNLIVEVVK